MKWLVMVLLCVPEMLVAGDRGLELGLLVASPTGDFSDVAGGGGGLELALRSPLDAKTELALGVGAIAYGGVEVLGLEFQWYGYPITVGASYYPAGIESPGVFVGAKAGALWKLGTVEYLGEEETESETGWVVAPSAGYDFGRFRVRGEYSLGDDDWTWFSLGASYTFGR